SVAEDCASAVCPSPAAAQAPPARISLWIRSNFDPLTLDMWTLRVLARPRAWPRALYGVHVNEMKQWLQPPAIALAAGPQQCATRAARTAAMQRGCSNLAQRMALCQSGIFAPASAC